MDPTVFFSRDPKACRARVGAWLVKEELAVDLFVTPELWRWPAISRVLYGQMAIHQHMGNRLRFDGTVVNTLGSQRRIASVVGYLLLVGV